MSLYEWLSIIISLLSAVVTIFLTITIIKQTQRNTKMNNNIQNELANKNQQLQIQVSNEQNKLQKDNLKIALYDKRLETYDILFKINYLSSLYKDLIQEKFNKDESISFVSDEIKNWADFLAFKGYITQFLFDDEINEVIKRISEYVIKIRANLIVCTRTDVPNEFVKNSFSTILITFESLINTYVATDILNKMSSYLNISNIGNN